MTLQSGKQTFAIHILPCISRSKDNQTVKYGQLIEYNMKRIFLENQTQNIVEKLVPNPFLKNQNWAYLWINSLKFYRVNLYWVPSWGLSKYYETKLQTTYFYFFESFFKKQKEVWGTSLSASFCAWFLKKSFLLLYSIDCSNFIVWFLLLR